MKSVRKLAAVFAALLTSTLMLAGTATAAPAAPDRAATTATAAAPTAPKYFTGSGGGPYNIAVQNARLTAYGAAAQEGYPAANCRVVRGPIGYQVNETYWQIFIEIYCLPPVPSDAGPIVGVHSDKCVDVKGANTADGTPIQLYTCNGGVAQAWKIHSDGTIRALGKCMDVQYAKTENGSHIGLNSCHGAGNQRWEKLPGGLLRNVHSGKCLDALGWQTGNGARLGIWTCSPTHTNQQWKGAGMNG
ncbi:RICIN domain-containing protein [Streptomyces mangrovi]|uniref:RICIN domain-containing protein n=1 Tax=Streptomyces mangrovi TaxID=1206892 RepID=UPI00399D1A4F